jgi:general secretion pathway protein E
LLVSQRLLPVNCTHCSVPVEVASSVREALRLDSRQCFAGQGCAVCRGTGVRGRVGVYEFFPISARVREFLWESSGAVIPLSELSRLAAQEGVRPLLAQVRAAVLRSEVSVDNALRSLGIDPLMAAKVLQNTHLELPKPASARRFRT